MKIFYLTLCAVLSGLMGASPTWALECDHTVTQSDIPNNLADWLDDGNKTVCFTAGYYNVGNWPDADGYNFEVASGTRIIGLPGTSAPVYLTTKQTGGSIFKLSVGGVASSNVEITDLTFVNAPDISAYSSTAVYVGTTSSTSDSVRIERCSVNHFGYFVIVFKANNLLIANNYMDDITYYPIYVSSFASNVLIVSNTIENYGSYGIYMANCTSCVIDDNSFSTGGAAFRLDYGTSVRYESNTHYACNTNGHECVLLYVTTAALGNMQEITIERNSFSWASTKGSLEGIIYISYAHPSYRVKDLAVMRNSVGALSSTTDFLVFRNTSTADRVIYTYNGSIKVKNTPYYFSPPIAYLSSFNP